MRFTIDHLEGDVAVLRTEDGQDLTVPIAELSDGAGEGDVIQVQFGAGAIESDDHASRARDILNEMLGTAEPEE